MFGLLGCLVYHRQELVKEYLMLSELIVPNVSLWHSFKGIKIARLQKLQNLTFKLERYQGCEGCKGWKSCKIWLSSLKGIKVARGAKVEKVAKSDFQILKISRLQGCKVAKAAKSDFLASTLLNLGSVEGGGGGGREINTSALNCNQLLNISKMVQLIFAKLVSHFRQLNRVLLKWQVFLGFSSDSEIFQVRWWWNLVEI